ncbi:glycosyl hydrolase family 28-related protein [Mesobacterium sp. TK19101]|uniref:Glycosyl hydrolase family 28-related protein n=1 Tax=Mesobacterium hydrothermale TaxID=3111907 RepID=A0ABU6HKH0_9RHOB|nr:glycosyl hydrolase family 28-related protein [Mesobacterium sp. TK19101]MEC3861938.1 glycosyl hydrolase family 28-related protein [Mesobacterium sp. TK19101]
MNKEITDGVVLMPTPFSAGLSVWSRQDGTPGSDTYAGLATAAFVPSDQDFGGCLELQKTDSVQRLRYMVETPMLEGCYLRVRARIKAVSGALPSVRIAGWAGRAGGGHVNGLAEVGPSVALTSYGEVVEIAAIIGPGKRTGVDMFWGREPDFGHFGLDLTGANGGVVRIDDIVIEDITSVFLRNMMDIVDVRDFGAVGDGVTDDSGAFNAADSAANGRTVLVSKGTYRLNQDVTFDNHVRFEGTVTMPDSAILIAAQDFELATYIDAFKNEELAFRKAFQALLNNSDHEGLDLSGRRVSIHGPIDLQAAVPNRTSYAQRRVLRNGQLRAEDSGNWAPVTVTSQASYSASNSTRLTNVANVANIQIGSLVQASGVGREIYVKDKNVAAQTVTLSQPLSDAIGTQNYTFTRFKFMLDFSGFDSLQDFEIADIELQCNGLASGILLAPNGGIFHLRDSVINRPGHRGLTSHGEGCQGMLVDRCKFISAENGDLTQNRQSVAITANSNDVKIRDNRATQFRHFAVLSGAFQMITGNHFFQGDSATNGVRSAGIVLTLRACNSTISGNYIDNCHIEWTNEREPEPDYTGGFGFAGLTITGNVFLCSNTAPWFAFLAIKPYGTGHFVNGLNVSGNSFRCTQGTINRVERVDTSFANLDMTKMRKIDFVGNTFHNIEYAAKNPLLVAHDQNSEATTWVVDTDSRLPFNSRSLNVEAVVARGKIKNSANVGKYDMPYTLTGEGPGNNLVHLIWPTAVRGDVNVTVRCDL